MFQDEDSDVGMSSDNSFSERKTFSPEKSEVMEEVLGFQNKDIEDSDDNEEISKESNFYDLPDTRAWGKKRKIYYVSDYVDTDLATLTEKDEENAALEEEEAKNIQKRLAKELDDVDFGLNVKTSGNEIELKSTINHIIKIDTSKFTNRQKLELLEKESPEFMVLLQDIKGIVLIFKNKFNYVLSVMERNTKNAQDFRYASLLHVESNYRNSDRKRALYDLSCHAEGIKIRKEGYYKAFFFE